MSCKMKFPGTFLAVQRFKDSVLPSRIPRVQSSVREIRSHTLCDVAKKMKFPKELSACYRSGQNSNVCCLSINWKCISCSVLSDSLRQLHGLWLPPGPLSMGLPRQEYWWAAMPSSRKLPDPASNPALPLQADSTLWATREAPLIESRVKYEDAVKFLKQKWNWDFKNASPFVYGEALF